MRASSLAPIGVCLQRVIAGDMASTVPPAPVRHPMSCSVLALITPA